LRGSFAGAMGLFGIAASMLARTCAARLSISSGVSVCPRPGVTTSNRIGRVRENSTKLAA
jgi:hypothetical protein